jgi:hypothetical protein
VIAAAIGTLASCHTRASGTQNEFQISGFKFQVARRREAIGSPFVYHKEMRQIRLSAAERAWPTWNLKPEP